MNEHNSHDDDFQASEYDIKEATRSGKLVGACAIIVSIIIALYSIYDLLIKPNIKT